MSYILQALAKNNNKQAPANVEDSATPTFTQQQSITKGNDANIHHHVVPVTSHSYSGFGWGLLLTFAILASLLVGYWLGQQSDKALFDSAAAQSVVEHRLVENRSPEKITATNNSPQNDSPKVSQPSVTQPIDNTVASSTTASNTNSKQAELAAENYFENPPTVVKKATNQASIEQSEQLTVQQSVNSITDKVDEQKVIEVTAKKVTKPFVVEPVEGVSDSLLARFQSAIESTEPSADNTADNNERDSDSAAPEQQVRPLTDMPTWVQQGVPNLDFQTHIYASDGNGWIKVNNRERYEGDRIAEHLVLVEILPQQVILNYQGERFSLPALSTW
ncbi:general secretion pathway protein GspB [Thalassotalea sp. PLHSN55]|uniref:general secretion pathway protein GspB n=1 Tax=Thalassotalea sp. PLHSN55 TaxID=3435888 RepID=UPI003F84F46A